MQKNKKVIEQNATGVNGWIILDKPSGMSSAKAVAIVKRLTGAKKAGHAGTLDPLASGVLPIALGEATKTAQFATSATKTYSFSVKFGEETDTDDSLGQITNKSEITPSPEKIKTALLEFNGEIKQTPPIYSAIKVKGKRSYDLARKGIAQKLEPRNVSIYNIELLKMLSEKEAALEVTCGKGTYVRSLARDLGKNIGSFGHVTSLRREKVGIFSAKSAILLEKLEELVQSAAPLGCLPSGILLPVEAVLDDIPVLNLDHSSTRLLRNGRPVSAGADCPKHDADICAMEQGKLVAIGRLEGNMFKPARVFNH